MNEPETTLDQLVDRLDQLLAASTPPRRSTAGGPKDAIDRVLATPARTTAVRSLRDDPVLVAFRRELSDGRIRVATAQRALQLLSTVVQKLLPV
ncbi:MAG: hypothetical protein V3T70_00795 [Phycisphaerae bacterium]